MADSSSPERRAPILLGSQGPPVPCRAVTGVCGASDGLREDPGLVERGPCAWWAAGAPFPLSLFRSVPGN